MKITNKIIIAVIIILTVISKPDTIILCNIWQSVAFLFIKETQKAAKL